MKISIVTDVLGEANNGTSLAAYNLISYLKKAGHEVNVICPDISKKDLEGYYILPQYNLGIFNNYIKKNGVVIAKKDEDILHAALKDADIVHSILPFSAGRGALKYCKKHNIPITSGFHAQAENATSHVFSMNFPLANKILYKNLWDKYYKHVDAIHFPTEFIKNLVKEYKIDHPNSYVISNGVETNLFYKKEVERLDILKDKFVIAMSGRFSKEKNQISLLKAVKKSKYEKDIQILLLGDGPLKNKLKKWGDKNLSNKPILKRFNHQELADILNMCDLYVHTSIVEIEAISCLEALACGLVPIISNSPRSATSKFSLSENCSYDYKDLSTLTNKIDYWIEHSLEKEQLSNKYIDFVKRFDRDLAMQKMNDMLIEVHKKYYETHKRK
jgi:glycosyltransferase involved in cell wall biosynthesis